MGIVVRGYGRASTDRQVLSTDQQHTVIKDAFAAYKVVKPDWKDAVWGGFLADEATSRETEFSKRHSGSLLLAASQPGDVIVVANYDRIFAKVTHACDALELLSKRNVSLIILDTQVDTTTIHGDAFFKMLAIFKEMEVKTIRKRIRDAAAHRKRVGRPFGKAPVGFKIVVSKVPGMPTFQRYLTADNAARRRAREMLRLKTQNGFSYRQAHEYCNKVVGLRMPSGKKWTFPTFLAWCRAAEADFVLPNGSHDPAPIPLDAEPVNLETITSGA
jgi:DNA invertase Pin-like site-specific DNA recombinase